MKKLIGRNHVTYVQRLESLSLIDHNVWNYTSFLT